MNKKVTEKTMQLLVLVVISAVVGSIFILKEGISNISRKSQTHAIMLTNKGFVPNTLTIHKGDTVIFKTNRDKPFWPASNPHPVHTIHPEFDPQDAIMSNKTWDFTFQKTGSWKFHDHLAPYYSGTIIVN